MSDPVPSGEMDFHPIGELYGRWALNFLVDLAHAIAHDFVVRPRNYRDVSDEVGSILADFRFKLGSDPQWPDPFQRTLCFKMLYPVCVAAAPLRDAAMAYQGRLRETDESLADTYLQTARDFREQAGGVEGPALATVTYQTASIFDNAKAVLACPGVAQAFGLPPVPAENWPLGGQFSGAAAGLVDEVIKTLRRVRTEAGQYRRIGENNRALRPLVPEVTVAMSPAKFLHLQRAAYYGARMISDAMTDDFTLERSATSAGNAVSWSKALQKLVPDVTRAWKDLSYRSRLTDLEWGLAPNPAGDPTPELFPGGLISTHTASGEVCCCSGDLDCALTPTAGCACSDECTVTLCTFECCAVIAV